jgi:hypothetical protein
VLNTLEKLFQKKASANPGWSLSHCFACSQRIRKGMLFQEDQVAFCERCFHSTPCWCCHLPCGPLHRRLSDERIVCQHCYGTALLSPRQLGPLYEGTVRFFQKQMKMRLKTRPRLKVTDQRFLLKEFGIADHTFGLYTDSAEEETIFIITGIAEDRAWITLAHELTHFWQKRNCPNPQDLALLEGFAEWTAYKLAEHHELYRAMLSMRRNVAEPYHTGLHTLLALEQKLGVQGVIQFARTETGWN